MDGGEADERTGFPAHLSDVDLGNLIERTSSVGLFLQRYKQLASFLREAVGMLYQESGPGTNPGAAPSSQVLGQSPIQVFPEGT